jgi:hypothetical protein
MATVLKAMQTGSVSIGRDAMIVQTHGLAEYGKTPIAVAQRAGQREAAMLAVKDAAWRAVATMRTG